MSHLLLDTHVFLWWLADDPALGGLARKEIAQASNLVFVSAASFWEIGIKKALGKLDAPVGLYDLLQEAGFLPLVISVQHAERAGTLPLHHRDPFDRMLIAQTQLDVLQLITNDVRLHAYGVSIIPATE